MLDKQVIYVFTLLTTLISLSLPQQLFAYPFPYPNNVSSKSALLMDANSGQILYNHNSNMTFQPASLAKVMTLYLVFDVLKQGNIKLNDELEISQQAAQKKGSTMYLKVGEKVPLVELIKGIAIVSGNDACVAIAENLFYSEQSLINKMNQKLADLNLLNSSFQTVDGWPAPNQFTTAYDMAKLTHAYINEHPEAIKYHKLKEFTHSNIVLHNRNGLIFQDSSVEGVKTGHVEESGYHLVAAASKETKHYIAVIMGAKNIKTREKEAMQLLDYGFNSFMTLNLFSKKDIISKLLIAKGDKSEVGLSPQEDGVITFPKSLKEFISYKLETPNKQDAPIKEGQTVGEVVIYYQDEILKTIPLIARESVQLLDTKIPKTVKEKKITEEQKNYLPIMIIILCIIAMIFIYFWVYRSRHIKPERNEDEIIKRRFNEILKSKEN